jgi:hypothetical protein
VGEGFTFALSGKKHECEWDGYDALFAVRVCATTWQVLILVCVSFAGPFSSAGWLT